MNAAVEADSFSSITEIAANPPSWPTRILQHHQEPLILYITRVPGSRDVFLTPLKPRDRIVTAQDVQSSLYYVHFNSEEDVELLYGSQRSNGEHQNEHAQVIDSVLGSENKPELPARPLEHTLALTERQQAAPVLPPRPSNIARKPLATNSQAQNPATLPILPPRPLPPIPKENVSPSGNSLHDMAHSPSEPLDFSAQEYLHGTLTLVRREPATSSQWNVATIQEHPAQLLGAANTRIKKNGSPLYIDVTNPAYSTFSTHELRRDSLSTNASDDSSRTGTFSRCLYLPGATGLTDLAQQRGSIDGSSFDRASVDMRRTGYTFKSPWHGDCQFNTSTAGRSLICKHRLPGEQWSDEVSELRFNLPVNAREAASSHERRRSYFTDGRRQSRLDIVRGLARKTETNSVDNADNDVDAPDFALGQEMAGGGFGGRQPKLGKLIINSQGMAMLDLLVAANVGLWWRAWEKVN